MSGANIHSGYYYLSSSYSIHGVLKSSPCDFIVHEITTDSQNQPLLLSGRDINFNSITIPRISSSSQQRTVTRCQQHEEDDMRETLVKRKNEIELQIDEIELKNLKQYQEDAVNVLRNYSEILGSLPDNNSISIKVNDGHNYRRQFYEYLRNNYSLLNAKPGDILNTFIVSYDLSLHSLLSHHVTPEDLIALYHYIHKGPQHIDAPRGVCIGANLTRSDRTNVYRFISNIFRSLESKTIDLKKDKYMKLFWKRKIQKNSRVETTSLDELTTGKKRNRDDEEINPADEPSTTEKNSPITASTKWFLWYTLVKVNLEQIDCCRRLSELLGISINHVNQAGIKDRRGYTIQKGCLLIDTNDPKLLRSLDLVNDNTESEGLRNPEFNISAMRTLSFVQEKLLSINTPQFKLFLESGTFDRGYVLPQSPDSLITSPPLIDIGMALGDFEFRETGISPGDLKGNRFNILLRDVFVRDIPQVGNGSSLDDVRIDISALDLIKERLLAIQQYGFPNFFGTQRMGIVSVNTIDAPFPIGPIIGKYLLQNNATGAVYCILSGRDGGQEVIFPTRLSEDSGEITDAMIDLEDNDDEIIDEVEDIAPILQARALFSSGAPLSKVLQQIPQSSTRERKLLRNLIRFAPQSQSQRDPAVPLSDLWEEACRCAIRGLPYTTKQLWLSSYQSWLWNHVVDYHLGMNPNCTSSPPPPVQLNVGDILCHDEQKSLKLVTGDDERDDLRLQQSVVLPMIGKGWTQYPENHVGRFDTASLLSG